MNVPKCRLLFSCTPVSHTNITELRLCFFCTHTNITELQLCFFCTHTNITELRLCFFCTHTNITELRLCFFCTNTSITKLYDIAETLLSVVFMHPDSPNHNNPYRRQTTVKPVLRDHLRDKEKVVFYDR